MKIRIIYSDLSEWTGDTKDYNKSPRTGICKNCKGILTITIFYNYPCKLILNGNDFYAIKDEKNKVKLAIWSDYKEEGQAWVIDKKTYKQKDWNFKKENHPRNMVMRVGKWTSDKNMEISNRKAIQWL